MQTYQLRIRARKIGAIGVSYEILATRTAESPDGARIALYDEFEHVQVLSCTPVSASERVLDPDDVP